MNSRILKKFDITFNPLDVFNETPSKTDLIDQDEDILQMIHLKSGLIFDLGWYVNQFTLKIIKQNDWDSPEFNFSDQDYSVIYNELVHQMSIISNDKGH